LKSSIPLNSLKSLCALNPLCAGDSNRARGSGLTHGGDGDIEARCVAGLVILLGVKQDVAVCGSQREAKACGRRGDPALNESGYIQSDINTGGRGIEAGDRRAEGGDGVLGNEILAPGRGDRRQADRSARVNAVDEDRQRSMRDLAGSDARRQRGEVELHQRRVATANVEVGQAAEVGSGSGRADEGIARESNPGSMSGGCKRRGQKKGGQRNSGTDGCKQTRGREKLVQNKLQQAHITRP